MTHGTNALAKKLQEARWDTIRKILNDIAHGVLDAEPLTPEFVNKQHRARRRDRMVATAISSVLLVEYQDAKEIREDWQATKGGGS